MSATSIDVSPELRQSAKRAGYVIAIVVNLVMLFVVQNILEWGWLPFLTEEFAEVVPWISFSLIVSIAANLVYQMDDQSDCQVLGADRGQSDQHPGDLCHAHGLSLRFLRLPVRLGARGEIGPHPGHRRSRCRRPRRGGQTSVAAERQFPDRPAIGSRHQGLHDGASARA